MGYRVFPDLCFETSIKIFQKLQNIQIIQKCVECVKSLPWSLLWAHIKIFSHLLSVTAPQEQSKNEREKKLNFISQHILIDLANCEMILKPFSSSLNSAGCGIFKDHPPTNALKSISIIWSLSFKGAVRQTFFWLKVFINKVKFKRYFSPNNLKVMVIYSYI